MADQLIAPSKYSVFFPQVAPNMDSDVCIISKINFDCFEGFLVTFSRTFLKKIPTWYFTFGSKFHYSDSNLFDTLRFCFLDFSSSLRQMFFKFFSSGAQYELRRLHPATKNNDFFEVFIMKFLVEIKPAALRKFSDQNQDSRYSSKSRSRPSSLRKSGYTWTWFARLCAIILYIFLKWHSTWIQRFAPCYPKTTFEGLTETK